MTNRYKINQSHTVIRSCIIRVVKGKCFREGVKREYWVIVQKNEQWN